MCTRAVIMILGPPRSLGNQEAMQQDVVDCKQKQTSLSRNGERKISPEWQVQLQSPARWFSQRNQIYLHLLSMWIELPPQYVGSQISLAGQAYSWCREPSSPSPKADHAG